MTFPSFVIWFDLALPVLGKRIAANSDDFVGNLAPQTVASPMSFSTSLHHRPGEEQSVSSLQTRQLPYQTFATP
jgi:hypothetical protein